MALNAVRGAFRKYPWAANTLTYGCMCVGAEFSQQYLTKRIVERKSPPEKIDVDALKRYAVIGYCVNPHILYFWYKYLDKIFSGTARKTIVKKVLLDQFCMTPPLYVIFYVAMSAMEGKEDLLAELRAKFVPTFQTSCMFWLPATTINFLLIPTNFRVVYVGACSFAWMNMLCWIKRKGV